LSPSAGLGFVYYVVAGPAADLGGYPVAFGAFLVFITAPLFFVMYARGTVERLAVFGAGVSSKVVGALASVAARVRDGFTPDVLSGTAESALEFLAEDNIRERVDRFYGTLDRVVANKNNLGVAVFHAHVAWLFLALPLYFLLLPLDGTSIGVVVFVVAVSRLGTSIPLPGVSGPSTYSSLASSTS